MPQTLAALKAGSRSPRSATRSPAPSQPSCRPPRRRHGLAAGIRAAQSTDTHDQHWGVIFGEGMRVSCARCDCYKPPKATRLRICARRGAARASRHRLSHIRGYRPTHTASPFCTPICMACLLPKGGDWCQLLCSQSHNRGVHGRNGAASQPRRCRSMPGLPIRHSPTYAEEMDALIPMRCTASGRGSTTHRDPLFPGRGPGAGCDWVARGITTSVAGLSSPAKFAKVHRHKEPTKTCRRPCDDRPTYRVINRT